ANAWQGSTLVSAKLSSDLSTLSLTILKDGATKQVTLAQGYSIPGSTARFRILGIGGTGQYIIRIDGSYSGATDGMFASNTATLQGAEGEAQNYREFTNSADAVFNEQAWA